MRPCGIPSCLVGVCDLEWGHPGEMHSNAGDGFYSRSYDGLHALRQKLMREINFIRESSELCPDPAEGGCVGNHCPLCATQEIEALGWQMLDLDCRVK